MGLFSCASFGVRFVDVYDHHRRASQWRALLNFYGHYRRFVDCTRGVLGMGVTSASAKSGGDDTLLAYMRGGTGIGPRRRTGPMAIGPL